MNRKKERREKLKLTFMSAAVIFCVLLVSIGLAALIAYILSKIGVLYAVVDMADTTVILLLMTVISLIIGSIATIIGGRVLISPVNRMVKQINRLASGDFKARLAFRKPLKAHSTFAEVTDCFNKMAEQLENTEMLRSDFVNNFSHEFKTPIVSIAGFAKLLRKGNLSAAQQAEYLEIIEEESLRLAAMATNVLNLTKIENQTILTDVYRYNLSEQLRSCVLLLEEKWSRKGIVPELEFDEYEICANEELLKQVWINLLDNAIKFSPAAGELVIRAEKAEDKLCVQVVNFGSDIPKDRQEKIFNKFYQSDESHASKGNGVGLAIVKRIVELHKGTVGVTSENGVTTFTVELPQKQ